MRIENAVKTKKMIVFGAGMHGKLLNEKFGDKIAYYVDNNSCISEICGKPVFNPNILMQENKNDVIIAVASEAHYLDMYEQLERMGFQRHKHFVSYIAFYCSKECYDTYPVDRLIVFVTEICNSHCSMCNVWQNKAGREHGYMPIERFRKIVSDKFFVNARQLRLSGGEPTLSPLLINGYCRVACEEMPSLEQIVLNVNCLLVDKTIADITALSAISVEYGNIDIIASLSLNGIENAHDSNRGVPGNYKKVLEVINKLRELNLPNVIIQISGRILKDNIWNWDEFLLWLKRENLETNCALLCGNFSTLNNEGYLDSTSFDNDELYQIKLIWHKIQIVFPSDFNRLAYSTLLRSLDKKKRISSCTIETGNDIAVTFSGNMKYCQAVSNDYGNIDYIDERTAYYDNLDHLENIGKTACVNCYFCSSIDYTKEYYNEQRKNDYWNRFYTIDYFHLNSEICVNALEVTIKRDNRHTALITGWYGTETVGDKAIIGQIISEIKAQNANSRILVTSAYPFITERTLYELNINDIEIVELFSGDALQWALLADEIIMGGGPLMEMEWLSIPLWLFSFARHNNKKTIIWGCGIGPIKTAKGRNTIAEILKLSDEVSVRDKASAKLAQELSGRNDITVDVDPAVKHLKNKYGFSTEPKTKKGELACFLREITDEYYNGTCEEYMKFRSEFEATLAANIKALCNEKNLRPKFYSMHNFVVGGDDRDFAYRFTNEQGFSKGSFDIYNKLTSIDVVTNAMREAELCLCMRFHSVVFADTLGADYIAIDYTRGGKIMGFLEDNNHRSLLVEVSELKNDSCILSKVEVHYDI